MLPLQRSGALRTNAALSETAKRQRQIILTDICILVEEAQAASKKNQVSFGFVECKLNKLKEDAPWLTRDKVYNHLKARKKKRERETAVLEQEKDEARDAAELLLTLNPNKGEVARKQGRPTCWHDE